MKDKQSVHVPKIPNSSTISQPPVRSGFARKLTRAVAICTAVILGGGAGAMMTLGGIPGIQQAVVAQVEPVQVDVSEQLYALRYHVFDLRSQLESAVGQVTALRTAVTNASEENAATFARIADTIEHTASASLAPRRVAQSKTQAATVGLGPGSEITGSISKQPAASAAARNKQKPLAGWTVRSVTDGVAQIEGAAGTFEAEAGKSIPGLGRVHEIKFRDGRWIVVTQKGPIVTFR